MFTDLVGYSAMAQEDERKALELLRRHRELARPFFAARGGRVVKSTGDGFMVEFDSALDAIQCAADLDRAVLEEDRRRGAGLRVRIGIHVGDVIHEEGDVFGDTVNIAARIEPLAEAGGVCVSQQVYDQVRNKVPFAFTRLGAPLLKNIATPIDVYRMATRELPSRGGLPEPDSRRLAVLPFANMSPDPDDEYFADGMTEELISTLSRIPDVEVISRTSVMQYKRSPKPLREIYRELGSGTVMEGSVRKAGSRLRVTVQMVDARHDRHIWAESYDRELKDILEIQTWIAKQVAEALQVQLHPAVTAKFEERHGIDSGAYALYLKGRYYWNRRSLEDINRAAECFRRAVEIDPKFALGYSGLGDCYQVLTTKFALDVEENREKARDMVATALELDPQLPEALATRGVTLLFDFDLKGAERELSKAIELKPSYASAHQWYSQILMARQRWDEAAAHVEKATELDPLSQIICLVHCILYEARRDYATGLELAKRAAELNPEDPSARFEMAWLYGKLGRMDEAKKEAASGASLAGPSSPWASLAADAMVACLQGDRKAMRALLPQLKSHIGETYTTVRFIADIHFKLGDIDEGFAWLEKALERKELDLIYIRSDEFLDDARGDERYGRLVRKLGLE
jgi:TolB-like protein/Flp pilus assembly protein TadD